MPRAVLALVASTIALAWPLASAASVESTGTPSGTRAATAEPGQITLRLRYRVGPWKRSLSLKLVKTKLTSFTVCAIRDWQAGEKFDCKLAHARLPEQTSMRLEQNPVARALIRDDSPGWGMLGTSANDSLGAVLSNEVTGDRFGSFYYRVTLRDAAGQILATSNKVLVFWHK